MTIPAPEKCSWYPFIDEPLLSGLRYAPKFCSPQIIMPSDACDGKWHMFFHSWIGVHHFVSDSGIFWQPVKMIEFRGHCPSIFMDGETYFLLYEKHDRDIPLLNQKRTDGKNDDVSRIEIRTSTDLVSWSKPRLILDSRNIPNAADYLKKPRLYNPQLFRIPGGYRLYFGSSNVSFQDSDIKVPRYFGCAESADIFGPFEVCGDGDCLISSNGDDPWTNLACGSVRVVSGDDGYYAFQCGAFWDPKEKRSKSALHILSSRDGLRFERCSDKPVVVPAQEGWASRYITGCDAHYKDDEKCWYCYFTACGEKKGVQDFQSVGLMIGSVRKNPGFKLF